MFKFTLIAILCSLIFACGRENKIRNTQFDILEKSATAKQIKYSYLDINGAITSINYPNFGTHPFSRVMDKLIKLDTTGVFCIEQRQVKIQYKVLWATENVLSLDQEVWMDCPMSQMPRKTVIHLLFTRRENQIARIQLQGSIGLLKEINAALRKRRAPYCSAPKIEEVIPIVRGGRIEVTPHYASSLCDTTFCRKGIVRSDLRITKNQRFIDLN